MSPGDLIDGRFRLEAELGAGGMGVVYRARDERDGGQVAVKVVRMGSAEEIWRAIQEIEVLTSLAHPAIVRYVADGVTATDQLYLAMEWIDGPTVAEHLEVDDFSVREAIVLTEAIARGLGAAHAAQLLHRDLKPSNIVLDRGDPARAKLIDFGLARAVDAGRSGVTRTGTTLGTPGYMSPEQARGVRELTPASDVFALGLVLYECLTNRPAFDGANLAALMMNIVLAEPAPLAVACPAAPPALRALVAAMLAKDPGERPADGAVVATALAGMSLAPPPADAGATTPAVVAETHCLILATQAFLEDTTAPPPFEDRRRLLAAATAAGARLEVLASGMLVAHLEGARRDTAHRAAACALAMQAILPAWTLAITTRRRDHGMVTGADTALIARAAKDAVLKKPRPVGVAIDRETAALLDEAFVVTPGATPGTGAARLIGRR